MKLRKRFLSLAAIGLLGWSATVEAANVSHLKTIINSSGSYSPTPGFDVANVVDGQLVTTSLLGTLADDVFSDNSVNSSSYWLTEDGAGNSAATSFFILDLGQTETLTQFRIAPTRNATHGDRGTTQFNILASNTIDGGNNLVAPTTLIGAGTLTIPAAATGIPFAVFNPGGPSFGSFRYVKFEGTAALNSNGGLNEIQVINDFAPPITSATFTGGDAGEGLDLDGYFLYARHSEGSGIHLVRDARFQPAGPSGQLVTHNAETPYGNPAYGATANDVALAQAMNYVKYTDNASKEVLINLPGLVVGQQYTLQMLINENGSNRQFDVFLENGVVVSQYNPGAVAGINGSDGTDAVLRTTFVARDTSLNIRLNGFATPGTFDRNPMIDAFTLEIDNYSPTVTVSQLTGGDLGEGLDLEGNIVYKRHSAPTGSHTIRGVTFEPAGPSGGLVTHSNETPHGNPTYGASADDVALAQIMDYVKFTDAASKLVTLNLPGLIIGREYKLQLLFNEACCDRRFDIFHDNRLLFTQFSPGAVGGGVDGTSGVDALFTYEFIANDTTLRIFLDGTNTPELPGIDRNPIIDAFTLELIPEPSAAALAIMAFVGCLVSGGKRRLRLRR